MKKAIKKTILLLAVAVMITVSLSVAFAESNVYHSVSGASTEKVRALANIRRSHASYYCNGTEFSPSASYPTGMTVTVRPYLYNDPSTRAGNATTYSADSLSGGAAYFATPLPDRIDVWANTNIYNHAASIKGYWDF